MEKNLLQSHAGNPPDLRNPFIELSPWMHSLRPPDQATQVQTGIQIHLATNLAALPFRGIRSTGFTGKNTAR
jgi:hypothetical protein